MRKFFQVLLISCITSIFIMLPQPISAQETSASGICKDTVAWKLVDGALTISGSGKMQLSDWSEGGNGGVTHAPWYPLRERITSICIEEGVTSIDWAAFYGCSNLEAVSIPSSVAYIGQYAFSGCHTLSNIILPDGITEIGAAAFECCSNLCEINIPSSVTSIKGAAFYGCSRLTQIILPDSIEFIGADTFYSSGLTSIDLPSNLTEIQPDLFNNCKSLSNIVIPERIKIIGERAFKNCSSLSHISIPESVTNINHHAFSGSNLTSIYLPQSLTEVKSEAFSSCGNLTNIYYGGSKKELDSLIPNQDYVFYYKDVIVHYNTSSEDLPQYRIYCGNDFPDGYEEGFPLEVHEYGSGDYDPRLSHTLIAMCNSVFSEANMKATFKSFGFEDSDSLTDYNMWDGIFLGYGMAKKKLNNGKTLALIITRGSEDYVEWASNLDARINITTGQHIGFSSAANGLYSKMVNFLGTTDFSNTQFIITGFSRGAAAANILAGRLVDEKVPQSQIYAYTFACPDVGLFSESKADSYHCIFNIADAEDIVSWLPRTILGNTWNKFGRSYWYSNVWNDYEDLEMCMSAHNQAVYLEYLSSQKTLSEYKARDAAKAALDDAAGWRRNKFFHDVGKTILGFVGIHCPVNVEIYDSNGKFAGSIINNTVDYINSDKVYISIIGSQKDIYLLDNDTYTFNISAIGDGTMEYVVQNVRADDQTVVESKSFLNVNLTDGKKMSSSVHPKNNVSGDDTSIQTSQARLFILGDNGEAKKEIMSDGSGMEIPIRDGIKKPDNTNSGNTGTSQQSPNNPPVKVKKIKLSGLSHKIASGKKITLKATVLPSNATDKNISWKSSNTKYATVNGKGTVILKKTGRGKTVSITAMSKDGSSIKATYKIKIMKGIVKKIYIAGKKTRTVKAGGSIKLKAHVKASDGANETLAWISSNTKYARVDKYGKVIARKAGKGKTVKITVRATDGSGRKSSSKIKIK